jgi:hypothetical protein
VTYRLTRTQIRIVTEMGGATWLRKMIGKVQKSKHGRAPMSRIQQLRARNEAIAADTRPAKDLAAIHKLSAQRVNAIRKQYAPEPTQASNGGQA